MAFACILRMTTQFVVSCDGMLECALVQYIAAAYIVIDPLRKIIRINAHGRHGGCSFPRHKGSRPQQGDEPTLQPIRSPFLFAQALDS